MIFLNYSPFILGTPLRWYAFFVLLGAFTTLSFARYHFKKEKESKRYPSLIDDLFIIAFPAGLLGARLWYVISEIDQMSFFDIFKVWEGGLAIQGGVLGGVLAGIIYYKVKKINFSLWKLFDIVIPNILIAQAIGRWGNFFNQEVYGQCVEASSLWFIPSFILNNMYVGYPCFSSQVAQPLFLYESILTLGGFLIISILLRKYWTKRTKGDLAALYLIYYGIVRIILEPLRNETYIMRVFDTIPLSIVTSALFIILGVGIMIYIRVVKKEKGEDKNGK